MPAVSLFIHVDEEKVVLSFLDPNGKKKFIREGRIFIGSHMEHKPSDCPWTGGCEGAWLLLTDCGSVRLQGIQRKLEFILGGRRESAAPDGLILPGWRVAAILGIMEISGHAERCKLAVNASIIKVTAQSRCSPTFSWGRGCTVRRSIVDCS